MKNDLLIGLHWLGQPGTPHDSKIRQTSQNNITF